jgi:alkylation response protein AidB-like acyl-CoA dehydrogenase
MDFSWSETQAELYASVLKFARDVLNVESRPRESGQRFDRDLWRRLGQQGLLGMCAPTAYGGSGFGALTTARIMEALGRGCEDRGLIFSAAAHLFACVMPLAEFGSEAIKAEWLPKLCSGEWVGANAITESEAGSDVFALRTRAERTDGGYRLTGTKEYATNGPVCDVALTYATVNPGFGYLGVTAFVVKTGTPNMSRGQPIPKMGLMGSPTGSLYFDGCPVPLENRLGAEGQGGMVFKRSMLWERACLFGMYLGMMEHQLERAVVYARQRRQFGKPIGKNQGVSHRLADMKHRLDAARLMLYRACWCIDQGAEATMEVALAKLAVSEAAVRSSLDCIQIHGGIGYASESGIEQMLRDAVPSTIFSGTSEIQRDLIAKELGL